MIDILADKDPEEKGGCQLRSTSDGSYCGQQLQWLGVRRQLQWLALRPSAFSTPVRQSYPALAVLVFSEFPDCLRAIQKLLPAIGLQHRSLIGSSSAGGWVAAALDRAEVTPGWLK